VTCCVETGELKTEFRGERKEQQKKTNFEKANLPKTDDKLYGWVEKKAG